MATIRERKTSKGESRFMVIVRLKGQPDQVATFNRKTDAKKWAQHTEAAIREGRHFKTTEAKKRTLSELIDRYIADILPTKPKSALKQTKQLEWWKDEIGYSTLSITMILLMPGRSGRQISFHFYQSGILESFS